MSDRPWTAAEDAAISARMWRLSPHWAEVAEALGREVREVRRRAAELRGVVNRPMFGTPPGRAN